MLSDNNDFVALAAASRPVLICFSHLRWNFVFQRPQHILTRAAADYDVFFVEEPIFHPGCEVDVPALELRAAENGIVVATPILPEGMPGEQQIEAQRHLLNSILHDLGRPVAVSWFYTPLAFSFAAHVPADVIVYDCMDELSAFSGASAQLQFKERQLLRHADVVFTGGRSLFEAKHHLHASTHCFPSSVDVAHFARSRRRSDGVEPRQSTAPRIGFFGVIDERMDVALLDAVSALRPQWHFVMIGPTAKIDPTMLPRRDNLEWAGPRTYADLPAYLAEWDAGLMPFALNAATRFISPTKTPEFLAAGLPVVSTPIRDVVRDWGDQGLVEIAANAEDVVDRLEFVLARPREPWLAQVDRALARMSWDTTWRAMAVQMHEAARLRRGRVAGTGGAAHA